MDHHPPKEIDLESGLCVTHSVDHENPSETNFSSLCDRFTALEADPVKSGVNPCEYSSDDSVKVSIDGEKVGDFTGKKKRKKGSSAKKPPKPPRPPRGFSLDAADHKLIRELAELAMVKRARIERMKALRLKKSLKAAASSSSSSNGSLFAMLFTTIFFLVILFHGMSCRSSGAAFPGSPQTAQTNENGLIFLQEQLTPSASDSVFPDSKSSM